MKHRISKTEIVGRFGLVASLWTDIVASRNGEKYHITAELRFGRNGKARWYRYIEDIS